MSALSPAQLDAFTGKACIGEKCFGAREVSTQLGGGGNWLSLLQAHGIGREEQASGVRGCARDCAPMWLNASEQCPDKRPIPGACLMPPAHRRHTLAAGRKTCSNSRGEEQIALSFLRSPLPLRGGVFVELGANDGFVSNTRHLQACMGWSGLLIEGHPGTFKRLQANRPGMLSLGTAICAEHGTVRFPKRASVTSGIVDLMSAGFKRRWHLKSDANSTEAVPCGPLRDWLSLLRIGHIDYFSLDVEGAELLVLNTVDWRSLSVSVLVSECDGLGCTGKNDAAVAKLLASVGMSRVAAMRARHDIWNAVYVNRTLLASPSWQPQHEGSLWSFEPSQRAAGGGSARSGQERPPPQAQS